MTKLLLAVAGSQALAAIVVAALILSACAKPPQPFGEGIWRGLDCVQKGTC